MGGGGFRFAHPPYGGARIAAAAEKIVVVVQVRPKIVVGIAISRNRRRPGPGIVVGPVVGDRQDGRRLDLAPEAGGPETGEPLDVVVARHQPVEPAGQLFEARGRMDAGAGPDAGPVLGQDGKAEDLLRPQADDDVEAVLAVGQPGLEDAAFVRIVLKPQQVLLVLKDEERQLQQVGEAVGIPQHRPQPGKEPEDDLGPGHDGSSMSPAVEAAGNFFPSTPCPVRGL